MYKLSGHTQRHIRTQAHLHTLTHTTEPHLDVLCQAVEHLLGHRHGFGEIPLARLINDVLPGVVPVEVTDGLLRTEGGQDQWTGSYYNLMRLTF